MEYDALYFGELFVSVAKTEKARRSYAHGISAGQGHIPYDTGATQNSVRLSYVGEKFCTIEIGGDAAPYDLYLEYADNVANTNVINRHKGFVEKFARSEFADALRKIGKVTIK